jgi:hypothetical protein
MTRLTQLLQQRPIFHDQRPRSHPAADYAFPGASSSLPIRVPVTSIALVSGRQTQNQLVLAGVHPLAGDR